MSEPRDFAEILRIRAAAIKAAARQSYDQPLREVMFQTSFVLNEAADEITALRARIKQLETITPQQ
jgi:hypothetical protein